MNLEVSFKGLKPRHEVKERAEALYKKLHRFLVPSSEARLLVSVSHGDAILELVITKKGQTFKAEQEHSDLRTALDQLFHTMEGQLRRAKERETDRRRGGADVDSDIQSASDAL